MDNFDKLKALRINKSGYPPEVAELINQETKRLESNELRCHLIASPINPSDILQIQGYYPTKRKYPNIFGSEGIARIVEIGSTDLNHQIDDVILLPFGTQTWQEEFILNSRDIVVLPKERELQLAMVGINPPTAYAMLKEFVDLEPGDFIIQNAANSAVGRIIIQLAHSWDVRTINIVRRESLISELVNIGADLVLTDKDDLQNKIKEFVGDSEIKLAFDAVAGNATNTLAHLISHKGVIVCYGAMSLDPIQLNMGMMMAKNLTLRTFWLVHWLNQTAKAVIKSVYDELTKLIVMGDLTVKIDSIFPISHFVDAFNLSMMGERNGKVLFIGPGYDEKQN